MKKVYHLSTCSTCQRIIKELGIGKEFIYQDMKYKALGLKDKQLSEQDYRNYILEEYTFLKRPVFVIDGKIFIGNSPKNVAAVKEAIS